VAALLTCSGGFLDAFTYVGHGHVFANSMSGNVVLLGVFGSAGDWAQAWRHVPPIAAFVCGVFAARLIGRTKPRLFSHSPALACLALEIVFLCGAAWLPAGFPDFVLVPALSFVAALQNSSFPTVESWAYNSVMTTGNLRRLADGLFLTLNPAQRGEGLQQARAFGTICLHFLFGAAAGAACTPRMGDFALLVPAVLLTAVLVPIRGGWRRDRNRLPTAH
jgi:uncharacterized membrane protein YoaK (UPF0700 family)